MRSVKPSVKPSLSLDFILALSSSHSALGTVYLGAALHFASTSLLKESPEIADNCTMAGRCGGTHFEIMT